MRIMLYTRRGCHLCETAEDLLAVAVPDLAAEMTVCDVDTDPALQLRFGDRVPVLAVDGRVVLEGRFDEAGVVRVLRGVTGPASAPGDPTHRRAPPPT